MVNPPPSLSMSKSKVKFGDGLLCITRNGLTIGAFQKDFTCLLQSKNAAPSHDNFIINQRNIFHMVKINFATAFHFQQSTDKRKSNLSVTLALKVS